MPDDTAAQADNPFVSYVARLRAGDEAALEELVDRYTPVIKLEARMRLRSPHLRAVLDSMDICQSVLKSFFLRAAAGQFDIDRPEDLRKLLVQMACNKSLEAARREYAQRRDARRSVKLGDEAHQVAGGDDPVGEVEWQELLLRGRQMLSPDERRIAEARAAGRTWDELAAELGKSPDQLRMQLARAQKRVAEALDLEVGNV
ncbi:MAG: sigma-70 family RNA polymerase sigma factor [Zavarzinella sp.]|nr:sigma-70 family RNA polymerase sigma factor [Zavarzinella sp.]